MNRQEFFRKTMQYVFLVILAAMAIFLGSKSVPGSDCSSCPGNGLCKGDESDCSAFLTK